MILKVEEFKTIISFFSMSLSSGINLLSYVREPREIFYSEELIPILAKHLTRKLSYEVEDLKKLPPIEKEIIQEVLFLINDKHNPKK